MKYNPGQWYKLTSGTLKLDKPWYIKFKEITDNGNIISTHYIRDNKSFSNSEYGNLGIKGDYTFSEINLSEIQQYLPKDHPDLIPQEPNYEIF